MVLVNTIMSKEKLSYDEIKYISEILKQNYQKEIKVYAFNREGYYEVDLDIHDIYFTKHNLIIELNKLIRIYENIIKSMLKKIDIIIADEDTEVEVKDYEENWENIKNFGLFITKRDIPSIKPYYISEFCKAYINLNTVKFSVYDM